MPLFKLTVNRESLEVNVSPQVLLLDVLREQLGLTGTKYGCGEGQCGACTVLIGGVAKRSCLVAVSQLEDAEVETIEGLAAGEALHPLQSAFLEKTAFQCGFCTPGMIMAAKALIEENPDPTEEIIKQKLEGNLCRCGTYPRIVEAVKLAAKVVANG